MSNLETTISAVTVYTDRARITRTGMITLLEGEHTVIIPNLPVTLEEDSVRVSGRGAGIKILSVETKTTVLTKSAHTDLATLHEQLRELHQQDRALIDQDKTLESRLALLTNASKEGGEVFAKMVAYKRAGLDAMTNFSAYIGEEQDKLRAAQRDLLYQREQLAKEIEAVKQRINQFSHHNQQTESRREIHVLVSASAQTVFEIEAVYAVYNAWWQPHYDVRLSDTDVELTYLATITQRSGEDWHNVELSLSTARPAISTTLPELHPHYIAPYAPPPPRGGFGGARMEKKKMARGMRLRQQEGEAEEDLDFDEEVDDRLLFAEPAPQAAFQQATVEQGAGASLTYRTPTPATVSSDGTPYKTTVTIQKLALKLDYFSVPKLAQEAYLRAKILNTSAFTLLPGLVSIFHGAEFVGKTHINLIAPNEEFEAQLGVDDRIKVKRELVQRDVGKKFIGSTRQVQFAYKITLTNLTDSPARITVHDQIPLSASERIQVKLLNASPAITEQDKLNVLKWTLTLKPNEKQDITFTYTVEHPGDMTVTD